MRGGFRGLALGLAALCPLQCGEAIAGPWPRAPGEGLVSVEIGRSNLEGLSAIQTHTYGEYGLGGGVTAIAKLDTVRYDDPLGGGHRAGRLGLQRSTQLFGGFVAAGGAGVQVGRAAAATACAETGGVAWLGLGTSGRLDGQTWFAALDAEHWRQGAACRGNGLSATFGRDLSSAMTLVQRIDWRKGRGETPTLKTETRLVLSGSRTAYSLLWREEQGGYFQEKAFAVGLARLF